MQKPSIKKTLSFLFILLIFTASHAQYIIHIAGNDSMGYYGDGGPAIKASISRPYSICRDNVGNIYFGENAFAGGGGVCKSTQN